jgi:hypothetical protein
MTSGPAQTPFVLIVMPSTARPEAPVGSYKAHGKRFYNDILSTAGQSKIISAIPMQSILERLNVIGWPIALALLFVLAPVLLVAGNVFRQMVSLVPDIIDIGDRQLKRSWLSLGYSQRSYAATIGVPLHSLVRQRRHLRDGPLQVLVRLSGKGQLAFRLILKSINFD